MDFWEWEPYYEQILSDFGFERLKDEKAARLLSRLLSRKRTKLSDLRGFLVGQVVTVLGNGPRLADELHLVEGVVIAADEAATVAQSKGIAPEIIVTDLDGGPEDLLAANDRGSIVIVHAHGDNMEALGRWAGRLSSRSLGTTQSSPLAQIYNFGGFTDGDRAVFLADHFGASVIRLLGFDFERPNPKDQSPEVKRRKLIWAKKLIRLLQKRSVILFPASSS